MPHDHDPMSADHDHHSCLARVRQTVDERRAARTLNLTPVRARVLEILLEDHRAMGAYEILDRLSADGHAAQPPIAYRALDFLMRAGLVHKIERLNAYVACVRPDTHHAPMFAICRACRTVAEDVAPDKGPVTGERGFVVEDTVVEAIGLCAACDEDATADRGSAPVGKPG